MKNLTKELENSLAETSFEQYQDRSLYNDDSAEQDSNYEHGTDTPANSVIKSGLPVPQSVEVTKIPRLSIKGTCSKFVSARGCAGDWKFTNNNSISVRHLTFCKRKSQSLMEIQRFRSGTRSPKKSNHLGHESRTNIVSPSHGDTSCYDRTSLQCRNDFYCFVSDNEDTEVDPKLAGMRVFASIMLNAWRRRRDDVRRLSEEMNCMKKASVKAKNQIHVISSLFKVEQKANDNLSSRLCRVLEDQKKLQDIYNELNKAYNTVQAKNAENVRLLEEKAKEIDGLNCLLVESKASLFKTMARERELETNLSNEQRNITGLENEKNELLSTIAKLEQNIAVKREVEKALKDKTSEVENFKTQLDQLEKKLKDLKEKEALVKEYQQQDISQRKVIRELTNQVNMLEYAAKHTFIENSKTFVRSFHKSTMRYSHLALYFLLPMTPPPSKLNLSTPPVLEKALKLCWG